MQRFVLSVVLCAASVVALAAGPYDGLYKGTFTLSGGPLMRRCDPGTGFSLTVRDNQFRWSGGGETVLVRIAPDGSFSARSGQRFITGRIADGKLIATTRSQYCNYDWSLTR
jgi:hypothetical protein